MTHATDWRSGFRLMAKQPGLAASAIVALGLGIGLTSLLFSLTYGIYLRDLPFPGGDRIMAISATNVATGRARLEATVHDVAAWRQTQQSFEDLAAFGRGSLNVVLQANQPERLVGAWLTPNGFDVLQARPLFGRTFTEADGAPGAPAVLVLGHGVWVKHFGSDPNVLGRAVRADGEAATVIGVMPPGFAFPSIQEAWMPLRVNPLEVPRGQGPELLAYGRLKPGVTPSQARAEFQTIGAALARDFPDTHRNLVPVVQPYIAMMTGNASAAAAMALTLAMGFAVLLIACVNVANLLVARAASRTREVAIRTALGASRRRLVAQQLAETFVLALAGIGVALPVALGGIRFLNDATANSSPPFWIDIRLDAGPLLFTAVVTALAALMAGAWPAWRASRSNVNDLLKDGTLAAGGLRIGRVSRVLVAAEIVLSFALTNAAGLMVRSLVNLGNHDYGIATDQILTARLVLPDAGYDAPTTHHQFVTALQTRLAALPGVDAATVTTDFPGLRASRATVTVDGSGAVDVSSAPMVRTAAIAPNFFTAFGRQVHRGRAFTESDDEKAPKVAIANASFADTYLAGGDPIGRRVKLGRNPAAPWLTIVGVAPDLYMSGAEDIDPAGVYVPLLQSQDRALGLALRGPGATVGLLPAVRAQVASLDTDLPVYLPRTLQQAIDDSLWSFVAFGPLWLATGLSALFLTAVGLYSLMAFGVRQRTREIGVRRALGAGRLDIVRFVARHVSRQVVVGLAAGAGLAWGLAGSMRAMVFQVQPDDPAVFLATLLTLLAAAAVAALVPVRRALRIDPAETLRDS
ncbi:MAG: ABC transporter permease [Vicinamibacterales bacterium]|nr:ABC transporter permease [Vicinamibacterales bacterium]